MHTFAAESYLRFRRPRFGRSMAPETWGFMDSKTSAPVSSRNWSAVSYSSWTRHVVIVCRTHFSRLVNEIFQKPHIMNHEIPWHDGNGDSRPDNVVNDPQWHFRVFTSIFRHVIGEEACPWRITMTELFMPIGHLRFPMEREMWRSIWNCRKIDHQNSGFSFSRVADHGGLQFPVDVLSTPGFFSTQQNGNLAFQQIFLHNFHVNRIIGHILIEFSSHDRSVNERATGRQARQFIPKRLIFFVVIAHERLGHFPSHPRQMGIGHSVMADKLA